ncbi:hypothetical protein DFH07DRAFT_794067 [Mycena maculata]|uniref:DUF7730 domain-containing protein n=1 Tax=Mycena maculata TaxID=230809 RepID=A0AAD7K7X2_9AGAR|nr:hypothetical protein DFH07DRAFT_794067 [Mycena maculata]
MPFANALHRVAEFATLYSLVAICSPCLFLWCITGGKRRRSSVRELFVLPYPCPLPTDRIDICQNKPVEQLPACHFLHLPAELRYLIFEMAVGHRFVHLQLEPNRCINELVVRATCYMPSEDPHRPNSMLVPADNIPVALLLSCRQVYLEALPIMHQKNTYHFHLEDFHPAIQYGLGQYCLPNIRSIYLYHSYPERPRTRSWDPTFRILQQMRLDALTLEFEILEWTELHPRTFSVDSAWCRSLLAIRGLRILDIFFRSGNPPDRPMYRETVVQTLRELMIGAEADVKYKALMLAG